MLFPSVLDHSSKKSIQIPNHAFRLVSGSAMQKQIYLFEERSKTQGKSLTQAPFPSSLEF